MNVAVFAHRLLCLAALGLHLPAAAEPATLSGDFRSWGVARFARADGATLEIEREGIHAYGGDDEWVGRRALGADPFVGDGPAPERFTVTSLRLAWGHMLAAHEQLRFSAQYDTVNDELAQTRPASNYVAAVGWRGAYTATGRARIGGRVYVGEESMDRSGDPTLGRRYFGMSADGSYALFKDHSPFLSLRLQRSDYSDGQTGELMRGSEDLSQFAAGWDWQVYPSWHVRAQAEYALNKSNLSLYEYDANRLFFSTRFDFR